MSFSHHRLYEDRCWCLAAGMVYDGLLFRVGNRGSLPHIRGGGADDDVNHPPNRQLPCAVRLQHDSGERIGDQKGAVRQSGATNR